MAAPDGQISVELKLLLDNAFKQAREAAAGINKEFAKAGMNNPMSKAAADADKAAASENKATAAIKERTRATKSLADAQQRFRDIASGKLSPVAPGQTIHMMETGGSGTGSSTPHWTELERDAFANQGKGTLLRGSGSIIPNYVNKTSSAAESGKAQNAPMIAAALGTGVGGPLGGAIADVLTKMNPAVAATTAAMTSLRYAVQMVTEAYFRAADLYDRNPASGKLSPVAPGQTIHMMGTGGSGTGSIIPNYVNKPSSAAGSGIAQYAPMIAAALGTGVGGPLGGAIAGVLTKMNPAVAATTAAMTALRYAAQKVTEAYDRAAGLYARNLASGGLGQNFVTRQNILAGVIGVSEQDVMQYGNQIAALNQKLEVATKIIADTQPTLTATAWNFRVLKENMSALWAQLAASIAPATNRILELLSALMKLDALSGLPKLVGSVFGMIITNLTSLVAIATLAASAIALMATAIKDLFIWNFHSDHSFKDTKNAFDAFKDVLKAAFAMDNKYRETAPNVGSNINRMPGSSWERMGMVIGQTGGGTNWNQKTAQGVARLVGLTERIVAMSGTNHADSFGNPMAALA